MRLTVDPIVPGSTGTPLSSSVHTAAITAAAVEVAPISFSFNQPVF
jgi:hypothetical protein